MEGHLCVRLVIAGINKVRTDFLTSFERTLNLNYIIECKNLNRYTSIAIPDFVMLFVSFFSPFFFRLAHLADLLIVLIEDLARAIISDEIYKTSIWRNHHGCKNLFII